MRKIFLRCAKYLCKNKKPCYPVSMRYRTIDIDSIVPDPKQARKRFVGIQALAESIRETGLLQPLVVRKLGDKFELIAGERRWRAMNHLVKTKGLAEFSRVKCQVRSVSETKDGQSTGAGLAENLCRDDLHPVEAAKAIYDALRDPDWTPQRLSKSIGRSQGWISAHRQIARRLHPELAAEMLRTKQGVAWRTLYECSQHVNDLGEPDLDKQRAHLEGSSRIGRSNGKTPLSGKTIRERAKKLAKSSKFSASVRKHIPEIAELLLGEKHP